MKPFFRPELQPENPANLTAVLDYLKQRFNYHVRKGVEYPTVLPLSKQAPLFFRLQMLCCAYEHYTEENWKMLEWQIDQLIARRTQHNSEQRFKIAKLTAEVLKLEDEGVTLENETFLETIDLNAQLEGASRARVAIEKDIKWQTALKRKLRGNPQLERIRRKQVLIEKKEAVIQEMTFVNERMMRKLEGKIEKLNNECTLLQCEIDAIDSRIGMLAVDEPEEEWVSMQSASMLSYTSSMSTDTQ